MTVAVAVVLGLFVLITPNVHGADHVVQKVDGHFAIVATGEATLQLQDGMIGFRWRRECSFNIEFDEGNGETTRLVNFISGINSYLSNKLVVFDNAEFLDIYFANNGSVYIKDQLHKIPLHPLKVENGDRVHLTVTELTDECVIPIVKGFVVDEADSQSATGGLPVWGIILIVIVALILLVGVVLLAVFHRRLPCFKRKPVTVPEDLAEVKVDPKTPEKKPVPKALSKPSKLPSEGVPPPPSASQPPPFLTPTPSVSAPPTATETTPTPPPAAPTKAGPPLPLPPPPVEPLAPPSVVTPPPPSDAPPTSTVTAPRFTAKGSRLHPSVPQHLVDNPTPTKSRSSERKRRKLRKNSLEEGNRPPGYRPALPPPPPPPKVPSPPTKQPGPSAETEEGKKRCCPEKDATAPSATTTPAPAFRPTKKLSAKEYLNFTLSEGSTHGTNEGTEEGGRKSARGRASSEDKKSKSRETKKSLSVDGKPAAKKPPRQEDGQKRH